MESNFAACMRHILAMEGGFTDDPVDHGGATNWGITQATLAHWRGHPVTKWDVSQMPPEEARAIYHANYWNAVRGGELPGGGDLVVFDIAVNSGPRQGVRMLQRALGVVVDGIIGPATMAAAKAMDPGELISRLDEARRAFYRQLVERDPSQNRFLKGWTNRVDATTAAARTLVVAK